MTAVGPETAGVETKVVGLRELFKFLAALDHAPLGGLEHPLLFIGHGLPGDESKHKHCGDDVYNAEGNGGIHAYQGGEGGHKDQCVLVYGDEEEVKEHPAPAVAVEERSLTEYTPAVILFSFPEFPSVGAFAREVEGEAGSPECGKDCHNYEAGTETSVCSNDPGINCRKDAPDLVHLGIVSGEFTNYKAVQCAASGNDAKGLEGG